MLRNKERLSGAAAASEPFHIRSAATEQLYSVANHVGSNGSWSASTSPAGTTWYARRTPAFRHATPCPKILRVAKIHMLNGKNRFYAGVQSCLTACVIGLRRATNKLLCQLNSGARRRLPHQKLLITSSLKPSSIGLPGRAERRLMIAAVQP